MHLVLLRHARAVPHDDPSAPSDDERPLGEVGLEQARRSALGLRALDVTPARILASPLRRARETAELVARALGCEAVATSEALRPGAHPGALFAALAELEDEEVLVVGHAPHLDLVLAQAIRAGQTSLAKLARAGAARVAFERVAAGSGLLEWEMQPDALHALGDAP